MIRLAVISRRDGRDRTEFHEAFDFSTDEGALDLLNAIELALDNPGFVRAEIFPVTKINGDA